MIDWQRVTELREEVGPEEFDEIVELFLEEVEDMLDTVPGAKPGDLAAALHSLRGSALNLGFTRFAERCQAGEDLAAKGRSDRVDRAGILAAYQSDRALFLRELPGRFAA
ncbi:Hpt domain-containing protein [Aquicoccus sp. SCR17]|nr:Hpt domain-containing protein [Carideicomes alvinocaridis]